MNDSKLFTQMGYYNPSFLQMKVDANCCLMDLNAISTPHYSTFFHEYIHFLQDMTTTFGLVNVNIVGNRLMHYVKEVETGSGATFSVSIPITAGHVTQINKEMQQVYLGQAQIVRGPMAPAAVTVTAVTLVNSTVFLPHPYSKFLDEVEVDFTFSGNAYKYKLGAIGLMETMANLIQGKFFPSTSAPAIPYNSSELVAQKEYPAIGSNPEFVFALCDICLLDYHPGRAFYHMLQQMKLKAFVPARAEDIYAFVKAQIKGPAGETLHQIFTARSIDAENLYSSIFSTPVFANEQQWLKTVILSARDLRLTTPTFMLNLYRQPNAKSPAFVALLNTLGTPLMFNRNDDGYFIPPATLAALPIMPDRLSAIMEMFRLFDEGRKHCGLTGFCCTSIATDARCSNAPWSRATDTQLCGYGQFWKTWALTGKAPL